MLLFWVFRIRILNFKSLLLLCYQQHVPWKYENIHSFHVQFRLSAGLILLVLKIMSNISKKRNTNNKKFEYKTIKLIIFIYWLYYWLDYWTVCLFIGKETTRRNSWSMRFFSWALVSYLYLSVNLFWNSKDIISSLIRLWWFESIENRRQTFEDNIGRSWKIPFYSQFSCFISFPL